MDTFREIGVSMDIKPESCPNPLNVKSKGVFPVAILGTADFDVMDIDVETVTLMGVSSLADALEDVAGPFVGDKEDCGACTDEGPDGFLDLTLKFDTEAIVAAIETDIGRVEDGDCVILTLEGNLLEELDGTSIAGEDVVIILRKGRQ